MNGSIRHGTLINKKCNSSQLNVLQHDKDFKKHKTEISTKVASIGLSEQTWFVWVRRKKSPLMRNLINIMINGIQTSLPWIGSHPSASRPFPQNKANKSWPILVQGLRRDIEINFHINDTYGTVAQWIKCIAGELNDSGSILRQGDFFYLNFF